MAQLNRVVLSNSRYRAADAYVNNLQMYATTLTQSTHALDAAICYVLLPYSQVQLEHAREN